MPGGSLISKPTWPNTSGCSATSAFFVGLVVEVVLFMVSSAEESLWVRVGCWNDSSVFVEATAH
jgi:hypothetical protein